MKKQIWLFLFGGTVYYLIEVIYKGSSHWAMFLVGGIAFRFIGFIRAVLNHLRLIWQCVLCGAVITLIEFISGCLFNLRYHWSLWDYSHLPYNILGQICLPFTLIWSALSLPALQMDRFLCEKWGDPKPARKYARKKKRSSFLSFR